MTYFGKLFLSVALAVSALAAAAHAGEPRQMTLWKNPGCTCCEAYAQYLEKNGFKVAVNPTHDLSAKSRAAGIPDDFQGCHLAKVDGYVVSGHVPVAIIERMLSERPAIKGVTLPGMPLGSPGMTGQKQEPFTIYEVSGASEQNPAVYAVE